MWGFAERGQACVGIASMPTALNLIPHGGQTGLALGLRAGVGLALAVAALELLARVDGGEMRQLLLARDLVGRALDDSGHCRAVCVL